MRGIHEFSFVFFKRVCEKFRLISELDCCQKAVNFLTRYYGIRRMRIIVDGRKVGNGDEACYCENKAYFTKRGLNKRNVLHELYHHIAEAYGIDTIRVDEERNANRFVREAMKRAKGCPT